MVGAGVVVAAGVDVTEKVILSNIKLNKTKLCSGPASLVHIFNV